MKKIVFLVAMVTLAILAEGKDWTKSWTRNSWSGYKPWAKHEIIDGVLHISKVTSKYGFGWNSSCRLKAVAGDEIVVTTKLKGTGNISFQLQYFDASKKWIGIAPKFVQIELEPQWQEKTFRLKVGNLKKGVTALVILTFRGRKGTELFVSNIKATIEKASAQNDEITF